MFCKFFSFFVFALFPLFMSASDTFYVGDLGKQWNFGSDHLPIGITVNDRHFASWNILDKRFLHWIETNEQGLKGSAIMTDNVPLQAGGSLTLREELIVRQILAMACHPTHPRSIIALQETNPDVFQELSKRLPDHYVAFSHQNANQGEVLFYDKTIFTLKSYGSGVYTNAKNTWMILSLQDNRTNACYTIVHSHIPGGNKSDDARRQLAQQVIKHYNPNHTTLIMGDQNRAPSSFFGDLNRVFSRNPFNIINIPYPTHVNTRKEACRIDNFFITSVANCKVSTGSQEFFNELEIPLTLFQKYQPKM